MRLHAACFVLCLTAPPALADAPAAASQPVSFTRDVAPILAQQCVQCHGGDKAKGKYRLDTFERLMKPGDSDAPPIVAGQPDKSELYRLITTAAQEDRMPQKGDPLPPAQVAVIRQWIAGGATFDGPSPTATLASLVPDAPQPAPPEKYAHPVPVAAIAFSPDGQRLAAGGYHEVTLWDPASGQLAGRIPRVAERVYALAFSPDGKKLAIADGAPGTLGEVRVCDVADGTPGKVIDKIGDVMLTVRFSPDGSMLAAGGADNAIRLYNVASGRRQHLIEQHADWVTDVCFSPDGSKLASASRDKSARVFDVKTGAMLSAFLGHEEAVYAIAWDSSGKTLFTAGRDRKVRAWNDEASEAKEVGQIGGFSGDPVRLVCADGQLFTCGLDGVARQYDVASRALVREFSKARDALYGLAVDPPRHRLATACFSGDVAVWDTQSGSLVRAWVAAPGCAAGDAKR